jgi:transcriptional regulator with XRE-family HTH domain
MQYEVARRVGAQLAYWRGQAGLSQAELGRRTGYRASVVCSIERGRATAWPKFRRAVAAALDVPEAVIFGPPGDPRD